MQNIKKHKREDYYVKVNERDQPKNKKPLRKKGHNEKHNV